MPDYLEKPEIERLALGLLGREISDFAVDFIHNMSATEESVRAAYSKLVELGLSDEKIATNAALLSLNPETIQRNCENLRNIGLSDEKIASQAQLLGFDPETIQRNYENLRNIGLSDEKIATLAQLLGRDPETIQRNCENLRRIGLSEDKIASRAELLSLNPETIQRNCENLRNIGLSDEKIASQAALLGLNPETIQRNYENLRRIGLSDEKIAQQAPLLGFDPETIQRNYENLRNIGLSGEKIATSAALLSQTPETIQRNYDHHIGLLGGREHGRGILTTFASLLGRHPGTGDGGSKKFRSSGGFAGTFQYLAYIDRMSENGHAPIHRRNPMLLGTTPANKREKIAWLLREVYDYRKLGPDEKKSAIKDAYRLVSENPQLLVESISTLSRKVERLRQRSA